MWVRFRDFLFDSERRELYRGSKPLHLPPKAFQLLTILIENRPKAVSREELYDRLWPETFVQRTGLHNLIYQIREVLDDPDQEIICTSYGFGFSFGIDALDDRPRPSSWQIIVAGSSFDLREGENIVGREHDVAVTIRAPSISRRHARIVVSADGVSVEDLGSKIGTSVAGRRIHSAIRLNDGDQIVFGAIAATLREIEAAPSTETIG